VSLLLVLEDPLQQTACHADVKRVTPTGYDVRAIDSLFHGENLQQLINRRNQGTQR
jgi:hypothetical protein